jgi:hypothetical protein
MMTHMYISLCLTINTEQKPGQHLKYFKKLVEGKVIPLHATGALGVRGGIAPTHS